MGERSRPARPGRIGAAILAGLRAGGRTGWLVALAGLCLLGPTVAAEAGAVAVPTGGSQQLLLRLRGDLRGRVVQDLSPQGSHASLRTDPGAANRLLRAWPVTAARPRSRLSPAYLRFGGRTCLRRTGCPNAVLVLAGNRVDLPSDGGAGFTFGARVRLNDRPGPAGLTVMQRGAGSDGPGWGLQLDDGRVSCRWSDGRTSVLLPDDLGRTFQLQPGRWYELRCTRWAGSRFTLAVIDPVTTWPLGSASMQVSRIGPIQPRGPMTVGGLRASGGSDEVTRQFHGDLDEVFVLAR